MEDERRLCIPSILAAFLNGVSWGRNNRRNRRRRAHFTCTENIAEDRLSIGDFTGAGRLVEQAKLQGWSSPRLVELSKRLAGPHAIQIVNSQLMHTVNDRFHHLARKIRTIVNPKGGDMSEWTKV
jgi:hypothetical protein